MRFGNLTLPHIAWCDGNVNDRDPVSHSFTCTSGNRVSIFGFFGSAVGVDFFGWFIGL